MNRQGHEPSAPGEALARLFVAIPLPDPWLAALAGVQEQLRREGLRLRYVRPQGIHLTLKFLGETPQSRITVIGDALARAAAAAVPLSLQLGDAGTFGPVRRPRVIWVGVEGELDALARLQRAVDDELSSRGFPPENRAFRPHLTLARVPEGLSATEAESIVPAISRLTRMGAAASRLQSLVLMQSHLGPGGARYTALATWLLGSVPE